MSKIYDFPFRGDFSLNINVDMQLKWKDVGFKKKLEYQQATIRETIEEMDEIDKLWINEFILKFLNRCGFSENEITLLYMKPEVVENIVETFLVTRYRWVIDKEKLKHPDNTPKPTSGMPRHAVLALIAEKMHIDPITFQETYTMEQMAYLMNWIEYWINAQTKEWQDVNKQKYGKDEEYDSMLIEKMKNL